MFVKVLTAELLTLIMNDESVRSVCETRFLTLVDILNNVKHKRRTIVNSYVKVSRCAFMRYR